MQYKPVNVGVIVNGAIMTVKGDVVRSSDGFQSAAEVAPFSFEVATTPDFNAVLAALWTQFGTIIAYDVAVTQVNAGVLNALKTDPNWIQTR